MKQRHLASVGAVVAGIVALAAAQAPGSAPLTPDGHPDLQGVWTFRTITPLERPRELANKATLTAEEAAEYEKQVNRAQNRDLIDPKSGGAGVYVPDTEGGVVPYNEFWYERGNKIVGSRRTSLIVDPPDGRLPPLTPQGQKKADARRDIGNQEQHGRAFADNPENRGVGDRCLMGFNAGPPMVPGAYNQNVQIVQAPGYFVLVNEMIHNARVIPVDGRPHGVIRQWAGDSRGRWEGDTLVVDTTSFYRETSLQGSGPGMHLVERFTRVAPDTINYEFTVDNPDTWTKPWTAIVPLVKLEDQVARIFEYACQEGNYSLEGVLRGARLAEQSKGAKK